MKSSKDMQKSIVQLLGRSPDGRMSRHGLKTQLQVRGRSQVEAFSRAVNGLSSDGVVEKLGGHSVSLRASADEAKTAVENSGTRRSGRTATIRKYGEIYSCSELKSEVFSEKEVAELCEYFNQMLDQDDIENLGKKLITFESENVQDWEADDVEWQKQTVQKIERTRTPGFFRHSVQDIPLPPVPQNTVRVFDGRIKNLEHSIGKPVPKGEKPISLTDASEQTNMDDAYWKTVQENFLQWDQIRQAKEEKDKEHAGNSVSSAREGPFPRRICTSGCSGTWLRRAPSST